MLDSYILYEDTNRVLFHALDVDNRLVLPSIVSILFLITSVDVLHS
jgi:heme/copper-type cytochrome/quinol oxidase subunit 2